MNKKSLIDIFLLESFENLTLIRNSLNNFNTINNVELDLVNRSIHTLKGSASLGGFNKLQELANIIESNLYELSKDKVNIDVNCLSTLNKTIDKSFKLLNIIKETHNNKADLDSLFDELKRYVINFSKSSQKKIHVELDVDKVKNNFELMKTIKDSLIQIIRNACDHGIESEGVISIKASTMNDMAIIEVRDNGRGIDIKKIGILAVEKGYISIEDLEKMNELEVLDLLYTPGLSTAQSLTDMSGRGVGMDIVKTTIEKNGGSLSIDSKLGLGCSITLRIPLNLMT
jgi:two-component system chemotaxis sensor kinase CheA